MVDKYKAALNFKAVSTYTNYMNTHKIKSLYHTIRAFNKQLEENAVAAYSAQAAFFMVVSLSPFALLIQGNSQLWTAIPALWAVSRCVRAISKGLKKIQSCESKSGLIKRVIISMPVSIAGWFFLAKYGNSVVIMLWLYSCMFVFFATVQLKQSIKTNKIT